jgi:hypothetical protein
MSMGQPYKNLALLALVVLSFAKARGESTNDLQKGTPRRLEPVTVVGQRLSLHDVISESDLVGPAKQPEWTTRRAFAETDIYVIPPGAIEFNQFYIPSIPRHGKTDHLFESEIEIGLPCRTQFDIEPNYHVEEGNLVYDSTRLEIPHALADWGKIPFNPAVDAGWRFRNEEADSYLFRLLLAEEFSHRIHFGGNFGFEQQVGDERETEYELNLASSYVLIDRKLTMGFEFLAEFESDREGDDETTLLFGPTALFKPTRDTHLGLVALFGLNHQSPAVEFHLIFGFDLETFRWLGSRGDPGHEEIQPVRRGR